VWSLIPYTDTDSLWQVTPRSSKTSYRRRLYSDLTLTLELIPSSDNCDVFGACLTSSGFSLFGFLSREDSPLNDLEAFYNDPSSAAQQSPTPGRMEYLLPTPASCQRHQFLVIYVHTAPAHHSRRQAVRSTWGNVTRWSCRSAPVTLRFVLGRPANDSDHQQRALVDEQAKHGDLVQLDFVDSYRNMTVKAAGALQWLMEFCANARWFEIPFVIFPSGA